MKRLRKQGPKASRVQQLADRKEKLEYHTKGTGRYIYRNKNQSASLTLPKLGLNGEKHVPPNGEWEGDSYFMYLCKSNGGNQPEAKVVKILEAPERYVKPAQPIEEVQECVQEGTMSQEKLILDQPDQVTECGKVEHVCSTPEGQPVPLNEQPEDEKKKNQDEVLLNENPLDGVKIIMND